MHQCLGVWHSLGSTAMTEVVISFLSPADIAMGKLCSFEGNCASRFCFHSVKIKADLQKVTFGHSTGDFKSDKTHRGLHCGGASFER